MKTDKVRQVVCVSEKNAADFEQRMNEALSQLSDPEIKLYDNTPYTAVILYTVCKNVPENVLELFEMIEDENYYCHDCPHFVAPKDKRKVRGDCSLKGQPRHKDCRACESFYLFRYKVLTEARKKLLDTPYTVE